MKRVLSAAIVAFALGLLPAGAADGLSDKDRDDLDRVSIYLNGIKTLTGKFSQVTNDGAFSAGTFYLRKPGRLRFEYEPPVPVTIVSDGITVAITNSELETQDRYPLVSTPLSLLLEDDVNLRENDNIVAVARTPGQLAITARETDGPAEGEITLYFSDPGLELRHWVLTDAEGTTVTVAVSELKKDIDLKADLFVIRELVDPAKEAQ
ncbi:MAG: outer-membrane lipoprotein carrier protein LolA [Alphaproteobacteria bacterium]|nr:outer-membrane lipoprotein carrier protein LolA [Alphaproteobacteria bacterium]